MFCVSVKFVLSGNVQQTTWGYFRPNY